MKKRLFLMIVVLANVCPLFGQKVSTKRVAILETVDKEGKIPYGVKLMIRSKLCAVITATPGYDGYDRVDVSSILEEHEFQRTGLVSDKDIKRLGEMIGADYILVAEVAYLNDYHIFLSAKILDVETAHVEQTADTQTATTVDGLDNSCRVLAGKLLNVNTETGAVKGELTINGNRYVEEYKGGKPHGRGTMFYADSPNGLKSYDGDWVNGKREGRGTLIWNSGERYVGDWKNDTRDGVGTDYYSDGSVYEGIWLNGKRHGKGKVTYAQNDSANRKSYDGDWVGGIRQGVGVMVWTNGNSYNGNWTNGAKEGRGTLQYADGSKYIGMFAKGEKHGQGTYYWTNGDYEVANYNHGVKDGAFIYYFADGRKRSGSYLNGTKTGNATFYYLDGDYVKEFWVNGKKDGKEEWYNCVGQRYKIDIYKDGVLKRTKVYR